MLRVRVIIINLDANRGRKRQYLQEGKLLMSSNQLERKLSLTILRQP